MQPYAAPQAYPLPVGDAASRHGHVTDGEIIADFAAVSTLASIDLIARQDITRGCSPTTSTSIPEPRTRRRSQAVFASTAVGAFLGGLLVGLITKPEDGDTSDADGDLVAGCMTAGMWGGLGPGILVTRDADLPASRPVGSDRRHGPTCRPDGPPGALAGRLHRTRGTAGRSV
jgi:hypothetical protein